MRAQDDTRANYSRSQMIAANLIEKLVGTPGKTIVSVILLGLAGGAFVVLFLYGLGLALYSAGASLFFGAHLWHLSCIGIVKLVTGIVGICVTMLVFWLMDGHAVYGYKA